MEIHRSTNKQNLSRRHFRFSAFLVLLCDPSSQCIIIGRLIVLKLTSVLPIWDLISLAVMSGLRFASNTISCLSFKDIFLLFPRFGRRRRLFSVRNRFFHKPTVAFEHPIVFAICLIVFFSVTRTANKVFWDSESCFPIGPKAFYHLK